MQFEQNELQQENTVDLRHYWRIITRARWGISFIIALCLALGITVAATSTPIYQAQAKILADPQQPNAAREEQYIASALVFLFYETQYEIIQSRAIAETVVDKLNLVERYKVEQAELKAQGPTLMQQVRTSIKDAITSLVPKNPDAESTGPIERTDADIRILLAQQIQANLKVSGGKQSQIINVSYEDKDPQLATDIINALSQAYIQFGLNSRLDEVKDTETWLSEQSEELRTNLTASEEKLKAFQMQQGIVNTELQARDSSTRMQSLNNQLIAAQSKLGEAEENFNQLDGLPAGSTEFYSLGAVLANRTTGEMVRDVSRLQSRVSELEERYLDKHPKMIAARSELRSTQESLNDEIAKVVEQIRRDYRSAQQQVRNFEQLIAQERASIQALQGSNLTLTTLEREVENNRRIYEAFMGKLMETNVRGEFSGSNVRIIDYATVPVAPVKPNVMIILVLSIFVGGFFGLVYAFMKAALNNTYTTTDVVEENLGLPALGITHAMSKGEQKEAKVELKYLKDSRSVFAEGINTIRTGLQFSNLDNPPKTILVTSASGSEGKSTLALNLAASYAQLGKTLLLEVDLRKPSVAKNIEAKAKYGLTDLLAGGCAITEAVVKPFDGQKLEVMLAGRMPHNPLEVLASDKFVELLKELSLMYDTIVLDGPPTLPVSDTCILGNRVDAVVVAVRAEETKISASKEAVKRLRNHQANLIGAVLTVAEPQKMSYYGEHYYGEGYYGERKQNNLRVA